MVQARSGLMRVLLLLGPAAAIVAWIVIGIAWILNSDWFVLTRHAFSDLGGPGSCCPQLYNYGLILVGVLVSLYGVGCFLAASSKPGTAGAAYMALAGVFLALIGVFPSGTRHHVFVSTWFFVQSDLALLLLLWEAARGHDSMLSRLALAATVLAFPVAGVVDLLVGWPSAAVLEAYGIIIIDLGVVAVTRYFLEVYYSGLSAKNDAGPLSPF